MRTTLGDISFQLLGSFVAVVRHGGVSAAANQLGIAKSAVSKHVTQLEAALGVKLLERSSRRIRITREGERLLGTCESLLAEGQHLLDDAHLERNEPRGRVRIAATPEFGALLATHLLPEIAQRHAGLQLVMDPAYNLVDMQDPAYDLAFRIGEIRDDRLVARRLGSFCPMLVASPEFLRTHPIRTPEGLSSHPCLLFSGRDTSDDWQLTNVRGKTRSITIHSQLAVKSHFALQAMAKSGLGVARIPDFLAREAFAQHSLERVLPEWSCPPLEVFISWRFGAEKIRRIGCVIDVALEVVPGMLTDGENGNARTTTDQSR